MYNECSETNFQEIFKHETFKAELTKIENLRDVKRSETRLLEAQCREAQIEWQRQNELYEPLKQEAKELFNQAKSTTDGVDPERTAAFAKYQKAFDKFPGTLVEINDRVRIETSKMYCMTTASGDNVRN